LVSCSAQVNVPGDVGGLLLVGPVPAARLLFQRLYHSRQEAAQAQPGTFLLGERGALVRQRILKHPDPETLIAAHDRSRSFPIRSELRRCHGAAGQAAACPLSVEQRA
jgi:hypothetical protein